jgi:hypothetical protein
MEVPDLAALNPGYSCTVSICATSAQIILHCSTRPTVRCLSRPMTGFAFPTTDRDRFAVAVRGRSPGNAEKNAQ